VGLVVAAHLDEEIGEVVARRRAVGAVGTEDTLADGQRLVDVAERVLEVALLPLEGRDVREEDRGLLMIVTVGLLADRQGPSKGGRP
jgi:hypothetical protein